MLLLVPFTAYVEWLSGVLALENKMQIAFAHGSFNIANTIIQFPLIGAWAWLVTKVIPGEDVTIEYKPKHLDQALHRPITCCCDWTSERRNCSHG